MSRSLRLLALAGAVSALIAVVPAGAAADTTASPTTLDFGSLPVGTQSPSQAVTLTETCTTITCLVSFVSDTFDTGVSSTTGYAQTNNCPDILSTVVLLPQSCTIDVSFVPNALGPITGVLTMGTGGPDVTLSGTGTAPPPAPTQHRKKCKKKHKRSASAAKKKCKKKRR